MLFETERLYIRQLESTDIDPFFEMQGNPNVLKYVSTPPDTRDSCVQQLVDLRAAYHQAKPHLLVWAVIRKSDEAFVGTAALVHYENGDNEIGYRFLERHWGNGYGAEVANGLIDYGMDTLKLANIVAYVDKNNFASVKILDRSVLPFIKEYFNKDDNCIDRMYKWIRR